MTNTNRLLTAAQMTAKLANGAARRDALAALRVQIANETGASAYSEATKREAARRLRAA